MGIGTPVALQRMHCRGECRAERLSPIVPVQQQQMGSIKTVIPSLEIDDGEVRRMEPESGGLQRSEGDVMTERWNPRKKRR